MRVSRVARSADYAAAVYANVSAPSTFMNVLNQDEEAVPAAVPISKTFALSVAVEAGGTVTHVGVNTASRSTRSAALRLAGTQV